MNEMMNNRKQEYCLSGTLEHAGKFHDSFKLLPMNPAGVKEHVQSGLISGNEVSVEVKRGRFCTRTQRNITTCDQREGEDDGRSPRKPNFVVVSEMDSEEEPSKTMDTTPISSLANNFDSYATEEKSSKHHTTFISQPVNPVNLVSLPPSIIPDNSLTDSETEDSFQSTHLVVNSNNSMQQQNDRMKVESASDL